MADLTTSDLLYTGKVRKVINHLTAFAEVTLRLDDEHEGLGGVSIECKEEAALQAGAIMGVAFALRQMENDYIHFTVVEIKGLLVDTTPVHVMLAAARAVWEWAYPDDADGRADLTGDDEDYLLDRIRESHQSPEANFRSIPTLHQ